MIYLEFGLSPQSVNYIIMIGSQLQNRVTLSLCIVYFFWWWCLIFISIAQRFKYSMTSTIWSSFIIAICYFLSYKIVNGLFKGINANFQSLGLFLNFRSMIIVNSKSWFDHIDRWLDRAFLFLILFIQLIKVCNLYLHASFSLQLPVS